MNTLQVILNVIIILALVYGLVLMKKRNDSFTKRVLTALVVGIIYGAALQLTYGATSSVIKESNTWFGIIGSGYVGLLKMVVIPLIFVAISTAITNQTSHNLGKSALTIISILVLTAAIYSCGWNRHCRSIWVRCRGSAEGNRGSNSGGETGC